MTEIAQPERLDFLRGLGSDPDTRAPGDSWSVNNSNLREYFEPVILAGHPKGVLDIIRGQIGGIEGNAGIDVAGGANGVALQGLISLGLLDKALVTNYRNRPNRKARNAGIGYVKGNILALKTWQGIIGWQEEEAPEGLALVMHRPEGGMQDLDPRFYEGAVNLLLDITRPGGVMFTQIPRILRNRHASKLDPICKQVEGRPDVETILAPKLPKNRDHLRSRMGKRDCVVIIKK